MKTLINPTDKDISVIILGKDYTLKANDSIDLDDNIAEYWLTLHAFLKVDSPKVKEELKDDTEDKPKKSVTKK